ncbi:MAG: MMPL family transporter [Actinomycetes bacterium]
MFDRLATLLQRHRRTVLALAAGVAAVGLLWGSHLFGSLTSGGFTDPASESARAKALATEHFGRLDPDVVVLFSSRSMTVDDVRYRRAVETHLAGVPTYHVLKVVTYWSSGSPSLVSKDRRQTFALVQLDGDGEGATDAAYRQIKDELSAPVPGLSVSLGGHAAVFNDVTGQVQHDIKRAEMLTLPVTLFLLVLIFGGLVAAGLPLVVGGLAVLGALTLLRLLTLVTDVSVFSVNIVTMLGLGLSIDYALFLVSRFREELRSGRDVDGAIRATMTTAGRTVAFSGVTVAISLASLLLFPQTFLRSMGFGGIAAVVVAMLTALTVLPALLAVLGHRVDALRIPLGVTTARHPLLDRGPWHRLAHTVMRRPVVFVLVLVPMLLVLGSPFLHVKFSTIDYRVLPAQAESHDVGERLQHLFPDHGVNPVDVLVRSELPGGSDTAQLDSYAATLAKLPGVTGVQRAAVDGDVARIVVQHRFDDQSAPARQLVETIRQTAGPPHSEVLVGGLTAEFTDLLTSLHQTLPWMALTMASVTLVLLFLAFGSVVLPVKAVLVNALSLSASFGAVVWIFQDGHLSNLLGVDSTGAVDATQPLLMLAIAFGLSMDYEVFLLSRVREQWDLGADNTEAVASGLQHSGRIITSAALLLVVVIGAFSMSGITFLKMIGVGMVIAILVDATVVRALLVPAAMRLLGSANWWAPAPLAAFWRRYGFREGEQASSAEPRRTAQPHPAPAVLTPSE